jgi:aryl-alcohol dehydrogenase-like predicted oxidoreductase
VVATKGGYGERGRGRPEALRDELEESFRRLRTDVLDLYYLHRVDPETPIEESLGLVREYVDAGRVRLVGVSEVTIELIERAREVVPIAAVQNNYSLAERRHDQVVDYCQREGIVFVPFFPLRGDIGGAGREIATRLDATESQLKLAWLLHRSAAILPIPGTLSLEHLRGNLAALDLELKPDEFEALS